jgi:hypothetical protein
MTMRNIRIRSELAPAVGLAAALVVFGVSAIGAQVVVGHGNEPTADGQGPATARAVVAAGNSKSFGRWEIVSSQTANGDPCVGIRLLEGQPGSGPSLAEACGPTVANQVGSLVAAPGQRGTLFFGWVENRTAAANVRAGGSHKLRAEAIVGADGRKYIVADTAERLAGAEVRLQGAQGADLGRVDSAAR